MTTDAVAGETDWFDLGVTISIEGKQVPFVSVFTALASGAVAPVASRRRLLRAGQAGAGEAAPAHRRGPRAHRCRRGPPRISRFQVGLFDELAELGVVTRQADEWRRQVDGLRALQGLRPAALPTSLDAELRPYQADGFSGWRPCTPTASVESSPTTWVWARPCSRWH